MKQKQPERQEMSLLNKHLVELLTEGQFTTVAVYFTVEADVNVQAKQPSPEAPYHYREDGTRARRSAPPPPWGLPRRPDLNEQSPQDAMPAAFPFIERAVPSKTFIYKCSLEMAATLNQLDHVVVGGPTGNFSIAKVWQVHATAQIDFNAHYAYHWLVQKVDSTAYDNHMQKERQFVAMLEESEKARQRAAVREALLASVRPIDPEALEIFKAGLQLLGVTPQAAGVVDTPAASE
jgi:hypothetical protein